MRLFVALAIYRLVLPLLFIAAFPSWVVRMVKRGGLKTPLGERLSLYQEPMEYEPCGQVHFHAVSVGESLLALKLIREWLKEEPERRFVLATGTATGHAVASEANIPGLRVTYSPLDFRWMVRRYLDRFQPSQIVLVEGEVWPHLMLECKKRGVPVRLVNARMSPRSARRFRKFAGWLRPIFSLLDKVAIQEPEDGTAWEALGIEGKDVCVTGSLKFDPGSGARPTRQPAYQEMLDRFGEGRPVVMAASTHEGEEVWIATAIREASPAALPVIVPRHAERRQAVKAELENAGFAVVLRSAFQAPASPAEACLVIDSTGELRDWMAHADVVITGKSFLSTGGQNPTEAILAGKPVIMGPHMENFHPLAGRLATAKASLVAGSHAELREAILTALDPREAGVLAKRAAGMLDRHDGATRRILGLLRPEM